MKQKTRAILSLVFIGVVASTVAVATQTPGRTQAPVYLATCSEFSLQTGQNLQNGNAELAYLDSDLATGMKYRTDLPKNAAMLFHMAGARDVAFWMQDTPSSLDIAFFGREGYLTHLERSAEPYSEELIRAPGSPVISYVLEVPAGQADALGMVVDETRLDVASPTTCPNRDQGDSFMSHLNVTFPSEALQ